MVADVPIEQAVAAFWEEVSQDIVELDAKGRLVDYLDPAKRRVDTPEERVRQAFARVLHEDYDYPLEHMAFAVPITMGATRHEADIAIYDSPGACLVRDQGRIILIVETKAPDVSAGKEQLFSYIFATSAEGGVWTDGATPRRFFWRDQTERRLRDWTGIPRFGETWDAIGYYGKKDLEPPRNLKQAFRRCHNAIYRRGLDSEDIAVDMMRLILAKYRDEQNPGETCEFRCTPSEFESEQGRAVCARRVRGLFTQVVRDNPDVFQNHEEITASDDAIAIVVQELQPFRFLADDESSEVYDIIGTAFEVYVAAHLKGERGQYFTNRVVVRFLVEALDPTERDVILDPAAGSGGFLIAALAHIRRRIASSSRNRAAKAREVRQASNRLFGVDISPKLVKVAKTNMILNGDGHSGCVRGNALKPADLPPGFRLGPGGQRPTLVLTNPPFGASRDLRVQDRETLQRFELGHTWETGEDGWTAKADFTNEADGVPPEILFLERSISWVAPGGRIGIVMARGVLDNKDALFARQYVLRHARLLGVVNCHPNTFRPFNGTKASLLLLEKKERPGFIQGEDYPVFMAISRRIGQDSKGHEIYCVNDDGTWVLRDSQKVLDEDMTELAAAFREFRVGRPLPPGPAWTTPLSRILDSVDMRFNPVRFSPAAEEALARVEALGSRPGWHVARLGDLTEVEPFNGARFVRPFAEEGVTTGSTIVRLHTPKSVFEERAESAKYLDLSGASPLQLRQIEELRLHARWILIVDSGTAGKLMGKIGMTSLSHEGTIANNNLIRVIVRNPAIRAYVYAFLRSELGQRLVLRNTYGTNQDHIEPADVAEILLPVPDDPGGLRQLAKDVERTLKLREQAIKSDHSVETELEALLAGGSRPTA